MMSFPNRNPFQEQSTCLVNTVLLAGVLGREGEREREREREREGEREGGREGEREGGREGKLMAIL